MSKTKDFMDTKAKARHRMRRYETRNKKLSRIRRAFNSEYTWYKGGYSVTGWTRGWKSKCWEKESDDAIENGHGHLKKYDSGHTLKVCKTLAARRFRRTKNFDEDNFEVLSKATYKRDFDIDWTLY